MLWNYLLIFLCCLLPIFSGYLVCFLLLLYLVYKKFILDVAELANTARPLLLDESDKPSFRAKFYTLQKPLFVGLTILIACFFISSLGSYFQNGSEVKFGVWLKPFVHLLAKTFVLYTVLVIAFGRIYLDSKVAEKKLHNFGFLSGLLIIAGIYLIYCLFQREYGLDWSRGFAAYLPNNRLTGTSYRVSGFMSHPLTLAYNLCLILTAHLLFLKVRLASLSSPQKAAHGLLLLFLLSILLLSQSRFPFVLTIISFMAVLSFKKAHLKYLLPLTVFAGIALYIEGSIIERFTHTLKFAEFDRLKFWKVHLEIFKESPIFGNSPKISAGTLEPFYAKFSYRDKIYTAHNIFIQILANYGIVGFFGFLFFLVKLWQFFKTLAKSANERSIIVFFFVFVGCNLLQNAFYDSEFVYSFWVMICSLGAVVARIDQKNERLCKNQ
ncbi:MAG: O-antigen ligase family protein [Oligoflexales bacterium]|nr:O-antigen ligase family protein [Oligoflexales bacterium]